MTRWIDAQYNSPPPPEFSVLCKVIFIDLDKEAELHICYYNSDNQEYYFSTSKGDNRKPITVSSIHGTVIAWSLLPVIP